MERVGNPDEIMLHDEEDGGNPDEIALDDDDDDAEEGRVENPDEIDLNMDDSDNEQAQPIAEDKSKKDPTSPEAPATAAIPLESIDRAADLPDPEARETVHQLAGTEPEQVDKTKKAIVAEEATAPSDAGLETRFLALDKCGFGRDFIQVRVPLAWDVDQD